MSPSTAGPATGPGHPGRLMPPGFAGGVRRALAGLVALASFAPATAFAQARSGKLDLYDGTVVGSPRIVSMGGSAAAAAEDMTGTLATAAAMAFRPPGSDDFWDWDFYLDAYRASPETDLTNSGLPSSDQVAVQATAGGVALYLGSWGIALAGAGVTYSLPTAPAQDQAAPTIELSRQSGQLTVGRAWLEGRLGVGLALLWDEFALRSGDADLFDLAKFTLAPAALFRPRDGSYRLGLSAHLPSFGTAARNSCGSYPAGCQGFVPPSDAEAPWQVALAVAWRLAPTKWNLPGATSRFRDERALVLAADLGAVGAAPDSFSVAGFAARMPLPSGRSMSFVARLGAECEIIPGRLRLRGGSYWEPSRVTGRGGRVHGTGGFEVRLFSFGFRGHERRVRLALVVDAAQRYQNTGLSVGFWH